MTEPKQTRIFIADDHAILRKGLMEIIQSDPEFTICGEAGNGSEALAKIEELRPDIAILDIDMPQRTGIEVAAEIRKKKLKVQVINLTMYDDESFFTKSMDAGVKGYVLKDGTISDILNAVRAVRDGNYYISPLLSSFTISRAHEQAAQSDGTSPLAALTHTERKVLKLISQDKSTKEIAEELFVSHRTIDSHRSNISAKLNLQGQNALLRYAIEHKHKL
jgi:DNA-binding NarL/FixJ family response regulator